MNNTHPQSYPTTACQRVSYRQTYDLGPGLFYRDGMGDEKDECAASGDGIIICKKLILGCKPEEADDFRPFVFEPTWRVYIKALDNVDMGAYVKRVTFRMSPRLPLRLHVADTSPFEITEVLSTDFPIELKVDYLDGSMSPTTYMYKPNDVFDGKYNVDARMNFQGHERRDKMFFMNPSTDMQLTLTTPAEPQKPQEKLRQHILTTPPLPAKVHKGVRRSAKSGKAKQDDDSSSAISLAPRPIFNVRLG